MHVHYAANGNFEVVLMIVKVKDRLFVVVIRKDMQLKLSFKKSM